MQVIALVGASGTGKSYRALQVAHDYQVADIIDDGLLLHHGQIIAGASAKKQPTRVGAVKAALFTEPQHAEEVAKAIAELAPEKLLLLGTSSAMVERIARYLSLPQPEIVINISDVATKQEIDQARLSRRTFGKHVIPAPTVEVKPRFSGTLIDPLRTLLKPKKDGPIPGLPPGHYWVEQSVVRPTFNYLGRFSISNEAIRDIVVAAATQIANVEKVLKVVILTEHNGVILDIEVSLTLENPLVEVLRELQRQVVQAIEHMTALNVLAANMVVKRVVF